jgi:hypothetical protein
VLIQLIGAGAMLRAREVGEGRGARREGRGGEDRPDKGRPGSKKGRREGERRSTVSALGLFVGRRSCQSD